MQDNQNRQEKKNDAIQVADLFTMSIEEIQLLVAPDLFRPSTDISTTAYDLYNRGLNVFPIPNPREIKAWAADNPNDRSQYSKPPYILSPLFFSRLHVCDEECRRREGRGGRRCVRPDETFDALFFKANIACMVGRTSGNLVGIDCDNHRAYVEVRRELDKRNTPYWAYTSHRGGGILMRLGEGEARNVTLADRKNQVLPSEYAWLQEVEIYGQTHYLVLPPSIHPMGTVYQWETPEPYYYLPEGEPPPLVSVHDLEWLGVRLAKESRKQWKEPELFDLPVWTVKLSFRNREFLANGTEEGSRNISLARAAYDMAGNDIDLKEAEQVLLDAAQRCNPPYPAREVQPILKSAYKQHREPARKVQPERKPVRDWEKAIVFGGKYDWRNVYGARAKSAKAAFYACIERSRMDDGVVFRAAERETAELGNFSDRKQAARALGLISGEWDRARVSGKIKAHYSDAPALIVKVGSSDKSRASLYKFSDYVLNNGSNDEAGKPDGSVPNDPIISPLQYVVGLSGTHQKALPKTRAEQDVFSTGKGLGYTCWLVWQHLCSKPEPSAAAIARALKLNAKSGNVRKLLNKLLKYGLVSGNKNSEGMYYGESKSEEELRMMATEMGILGKSENRDRTHRIERECEVNRKLAFERRRWHDRREKWQADLDGEEKGYE